MKKIFSEVAVVVISLVMGFAPIPTASKPPSTSESAAPKTTAIVEQVSKIEPVTVAAAPVETPPPEAQPVPEPEPEPAPTYTAPSLSVDEASAKAFIYQHESGNRTDAINASSGACGLGQALPCSKMGCSLDDYGCQDNFFTNYAMSRYGSWGAAYNWWQAHRWW